MRRYTWGYENRITSATSGKTTVSYIYDALGRRVQRVLPATGENTKFIYDGQDVLVDDDNGVLTKYQNGPGIDNKLKMYRSGAARYFITDHLGSTNGWATPGGGLSASTAAYDGFGNVVTNLPTRYRYTGREYDSFTGLHYYRARWYDSQIGRFISEDPIGFAGGDVNLYCYVWNNPLTYKDPYGLWAGWDDVVFISARECKRNCVTVH